MQEQLQYPNQEQLPLAQLMPVNQHEGKSAVSLRDLHAFLEVKKDFTDWAKDQFAYGFVEHQDYVEVYEQTSQLENPKFGEYGNLRRKARRNWAITLDMAKELSMIQRTEKGKQARQYFISMEQVALAAPRAKTLAERSLELLSDLSAEVEAQAKELEAVRPLADQARTFREAEGLRTLGDLTNDLKVHAASNYPGQKVLRDDVYDLAGELGLIIRGNTVRNNQPTSRAIEAAWVKPKSTLVETKTRGSYTAYTAHLTNRGYGRVWDEAVKRMRNGQPIFNRKAAA